MNQSRLALFPDSTQVVQGGKELFIGGCSLVDLAERFGTPLYLYDQETLDGALREYRQALAAFYPQESAVTYAGKAFLSVAMAQWVARNDLWLDCTGAGELHIAHVAGVPRERILVHGVNKSAGDLAAAVEQAGVIVVDNLTELNQLIGLLAHVDTQPELWIRVRPGVAVETHAYTQTGQQTSKFGMGLAEAVEAVHLCRQHDLALTGLHFHQGSHFHDPAPIGPALDTVLDLIEELHDQSGWLPGALSPGGGWGVAYHEDDLPHPTITDYVEFVARSLAEGCRQRDLPLFRLQLEPGRSIVARAGVALYRIGAVKETGVKGTGERRWLLIDGGLADNPRPALYEARYSALPVTSPQRSVEQPVWIGGPFCESGDVLIENLPFPTVTAGELLAVPVSGAYQVGMASNYNGARKNAIVWLDRGQAQLIQRRETLDDLVRRDQKLASD